VTIIVISHDLTILQIKSQTESVFQIKSFNLKLNCQNGSNGDLNPNRDWDLPIAALHVKTTSLNYHIFDIYQFITCLNMGNHDVEMVKFNLTFT